MIGALLPLLVGLIVLYPQLGQKSTDQKSTSNENEDKEADEEDVTESSQLITEKD